jgi:hypothetical protein
MCWRGYAHDEHRPDSTLVEGTQPAKARERPKGCTPKPPK